MLQLWAYLAWYVNTQCIQQCKSPALWMSVHACAACTERCKSTHRLSHCKCCTGHNTASSRLRPLSGCSMCSSSACLQGYCVPGCAEDVIGMTFYKYILTNVVSINGVELMTALGKKCLHMASHMEPPWVCIIVFSAALQGAPTFSTL